MKKTSAIILLAVLALAFIAVGTTTDLIGFVMNIDGNLSMAIQNYGIWVYVILFGIIFMETGFVVTPFLPGDSLIFAAGAFAALGSLDMSLLFVTLSIASIAGDTVNYQIGHFSGPKIFTEQKSFLKKEYLESAKGFYERHGKKTIVIARFVPIMRTFAPFVAGIGKMSYWRFISYNVFGGMLWVAAFLTFGYFFGNLAVVRENFMLVILSIIVISLTPIVFEVVRNGRKPA